MSEAAIAKKAEVVKQTADLINAAQSAIVVDYRGLTVAEVTDLRKQLRDAGVKMSVIKNKILDRKVPTTKICGQLLLVQLLWLSPMRTQLPQLRS